MTAQVQALGSPTSVRLWLGVLVPPLAWALHLGVGYPLVLVACAKESSAILHLWTALTAAACAASGLLARGNARRLTTAGAEPGSDPRERAVFLARAGFHESWFFLAVIVFEWLPVLFLDPCL